MLKELKEMTIKGLEAQSPEFCAYLGRVVKEAARGGNGAGAWSEEKLQEEGEARGVEFPVSFARTFFGAHGMPFEERAADDRYVWKVSWI